MSRHRSARRITSLAGLLCLWPSGPAGAGDRPSAASGRADAEEAIVQVVTIRRADGARQPRGSAFYIDADGHLLTCAHVLDQMPNDESPRLRLRGGTELRFDVVKVERELDLAVLRSDPPRRYLVLGDRFRPEPGEAVLLGGFPSRADAATGGPPRLKAARVVGLERRWAAGPRRSVRSRRRVLTIKVDEVADRGQSGGPLLAQSTFAAIGVVRANLESATGGLGGAASPGYGAAVPLLYVRPFVDSALPE